MANTITRQVLLDGEVHSVIKVHIKGDGTGEESATRLAVAGDLNPVATNLKIMSIESTFTGFSATLLWDGAPDTEAVQIPEGETILYYAESGGLINNATARTGDILITTVGLGSGDQGTILLHVTKKI